MLRVTARLAHRLGTIAPSQLPAELNKGAENRPDTVDALTGASGFSPEVVSVL